MILPETLKPLSFLGDFNDDYLREIAAIAELKDLPAATVVFREGEASSNIYIPTEGRIGLEIRVPKNSVRIFTVGPGELLGWSPLLGTARMTATARTLTPCRLVVLHAPQLLALCQHNPKLGFEFIRRTALALAQRLNATRLQLLDVYGQELPVVADRGGPA